MYRFNKCECYLLIKDDQTVFQKVCKYNFSHCRFWCVFVQVQCYTLHSHQSRANTTCVISIKNANFSTEVPFFLLKLFSTIRLDTARIDKTLCLEANQVIKAKSFITSFQNWNVSKEKRKYCLEYDYTDNTFRQYNTQFKVYYILKIINLLHSYRNSVYYFSLYLFKQPW